jgi:hypothetical protein
MDFMIPLRLAYFLGGFADLAQRGALGLRCRAWIVQGDFQHGLSPLQMGFGLLQFFGIFHRDLFSGPRPILGS